MRQNTEAAGSDDMDPTPTTIYDIETPALAVDLNALEQNIVTMASACESGNTHLRPHIKNHKCPDIAKLQIAAGATGVTCATLNEASGMFRGGVDDILIANQVVGPVKIARLCTLVSRGANIQVAVDSGQNARALSAAASSADVDLGILIDLDVGLHRCGVQPGSDAVALAKIVESLPRLQLRGLMAFDGHVHHTPGPEGRDVVASEAMQLAVDTKILLEAAGLPCPTISASSTKSYMTALRIRDITEIQAGMYLFMDTMYQREYSYLKFHQALFVLSTVISRHGDRAVADAGIKSVTGFGGPPSVRGRDDCRVSELSGEHASLQLTNESKLAIGDLLWLVPGYGDGAARLHDKIHAIRSTIVEDVWPIDG